jgi:hypothetical protein
MGDGSEPSQLNKRLLLGLSPSKSYIVINLHRSIAEPHHFVGAPVLGLGSGKNKSCGSGSCSSKENDAATALQHCYRVYISNM